MTFFVYGLYDPIEPEHIRYIGAASSLRRIKDHIADVARIGMGNYKVCWQRSVRNSGRKFGWKILEACDSWEEAVATEKIMIPAYRKAGYRLTNLTNGGEGNINPPNHRNTIKTHCPNGHSYDYVVPKTGYRQCRVCSKKREMNRSAYQAEWRRKNPERSRDIQRKAEGKRTERYHIDPIYREYRLVQNRSYLGG